MKLRPCFFFLLSFVFCLILAMCIERPALCQIPQGFNYQAVARNSSGNPIPNTAMPVMITIQADSLGTNVIWKELHSSVITNGLGLINLVIGKGAKQSGTVSAFSEIDWSVTPKFIKTEIDYNGWKTMGVTRLWSVPYAMAAGGGSPLFNKISVAGVTAVNDEALFEVKNKDGNTVFAVYNEGVRVYVSDGEKGLKGGFAVGGFGTDKAESQKYLVVSKDSIRMYLDTDPSSKKLKGGFAVGGYDMTKGTSVEDYLQVTRDSTRIYVKENPGKKLKGGFAVGGFDMTKGSQNFTPFTSLTSDNYFIGHEAGYGNTTGKYNSFFGYKAGRTNKAGSYNVFIGHYSGFYNTEGWANLFIGDSAGFENTTGYYNVALGTWAGQYNKTGRFNVAVGANAGLHNETGNQNVYIGMQAGARNVTGSYNTLVGSGAGEFATEGSKNVFIGNLAGWNVVSGETNVYIGNIAGRDNQTGIRNVYVGDFAGSAMTEGSENVIIGKSAAALTHKGFRNVFLGAWAGNQVDSAQYCVFLGPSAGWTSKNGLRNIFIGPFAGYSNEGSDNVFLGNEAGYYETSSNKLYISNTATASPLIFGEFNNGRVVINGNSGHNLGNHNFFVNGTAGGMSSWFNYSDRNMKHDISTIPDALQKVMKLRGVNFFWNDPAEGMEGKQMGFIGQEACQVIPEVVSVTNNHFSMQYAPVTALLVEAVKEQQAIIDHQQAEIDRLKSLEQEIADLKIIVAGLSERNK